MMSFLLLSSVLSNCQFPKLVNHKDAWYSNNADGAHLTAYIRPHIIEAKFCLFDSTSCEQYTRSCVENMGQNRYLVKHVIASQGYSPSYYLCMQFILRSDNIMQIKSSQRSDIPSNSLCSDDNLVMDNWPLFSTSLRSAKPIQCPFSGGYNMRIKSNGRELCPDKMLSPRIESECETGDGIKFDFKHPACIHQNLKMKLIHRADCMATWTVKGYNFVILRPNSNRFQALCLRIKKPLNNIKHAYLFMDLVCDPGNTHGQPEETSNYLSIEFERKYIHSVCEDEFEGCSDDRFCRTEMRENCRLSCGTCQPDVKLCAFPEHLRRVWTLYGGSKSVRNVSITTYEIGFPDVGRFQCLFNDVSSKHRSILLHTFENGCYPKFTCMETYFSSESVRQFRLSTRINWPMFPLAKVRNLACKMAMFRKKIRIGEDMEYVKIPKITVVDSSYTKSVNCKLSHEFRNHVNGLYFREGNKCDGCVYYDNKVQSQSFEIRPIQCPNTTGFIEYICLASFKFDNETTAVVTGTRVSYASKITQFLCWVFTGSGSMRKIVVFNAADCNDVKLKLALAEEFVPRSMFDVVEKPPKHCPLAINDDPFLPESRLPDIVSKPSRKTPSPKIYTVTKSPLPPKTAGQLNSQSENLNSAHVLSFYKSVILFCFLLVAEYI